MHVFQAPSCGVYLFLCCKDETLKEKEERRDTLLLVRNIIHPNPSSQTFEPHKGRRLRSSKLGSREIDENGGG
jgi:hypothetical protein